MGVEPEATTKEKVWRFVESPIAWGGIGLLGGAITALIPVVGLKWFFVVAWGLEVCAQLKERFWSDEGWIVRITANVFLAIVFGAAFLAGWYYMPKPNEPATPEQIADEICKHSPYLCTPPETEPPPIITHEAACHLNFSVSAEPIARLYGRHDIRATPNTQLPIDFQELFYEWKASFSINLKTSEFSVKIDHLTDVDVVTVSPAALSQVSEPSPEWFSGFKEPSRTKPDYYSRLITVSNLPKGDKVVISLRRALGTTEISPVNMVKIEDARTENCAAVIPVFDENVEAGAFNAKLQALAGFKYGQLGGQPRALPLGHDPGDVGPNEVEATVEARCKNPTCTQTVVGHLEVHMGKPPGEYFKQPH
jgi:hypothetical protein